MMAKYFSLPAQYYLLILPLIFGFGIGAQGQDPLRFEEEVKQIQQKYEEVPPLEGSIVFTGSSSIKMWKEIQSDFPEQPIINTGFGGSQTSDLIHYVDELIIEYQPKKIFIYEGDNDISEGKTTSEIMEDMHTLVGKIKTKLPEAQIFLISAKPSISRWHLKDKYLELNSQFEEYQQSHDNIEYVDVWTPMLDGEGNPKADIFLEDQLHMNPSGYEIWAKVLDKYIP
jgi:lysophospholipase L1-like esterase